ncbi:MAG TPA: indole-3-glycerol phosphate synthase TrpC [Candidatus Binataceae bacterium]|jgi:indole-3-glycerol phosphate synthase/phosphoribosylanthranilate isomerase|nr:indole-3-glycerol phosphate synthase TrpC [Candidatus Binataceae bacterium]
MASVLERIFAAKRTELEQQRREIGLEEIKARAADAAPPRDFVGALKGRQPAIIAEIKRASPSKGDILPGLDPASVARGYAATGAAAISVLTDPRFKGSLNDLCAARAAVDLPLLRKDFMFDPYQLYEARAAGADCILLIAAMLSENDLRVLAALARELNMAALVEVHDESELRTAERIGAALIGINNRDLHTFVTDIAVSERLMRAYRGDALLVSESGIESAADIARLDEAGARAFLIGESLLRYPTPRVLLGDFLYALDFKSAIPLAPSNRSAAHHARPGVRVKVCGITRVEDALAALEAGADMIGLNFYPPSPRFVELKRACEIRNAIGGRAEIVGVFVNPTRAEIEQHDREVRLDMIQLHGDEAVEEFFGWPFAVIGAVKVGGDGLPSRAPCWGHYVLYDATDAKLHGGTGRRVPLEWFRNRNLSHSFISGGLTADNVAEAAALRPYGVDVASGIESAPGIKDHVKLRSFIQNAKSAG